MTRYGRLAGVLREPRRAVLDLPIPYCSNPSHYVGSLAGRSGNKQVGEEGATRLRSRPHKGALSRLGRSYRLLLSLFGVESFAKQRCAAQSSALAPASTGCGIRRWASRRCRNTAQKAARTRHCRTVHTCSNGYGLAATDKSSAWYRSIPHHVSLPGRCFEAPWKHLSR